VNKFRIFFLQVSKLSAVPRFPIKHKTACTRGYFKIGSCPRHRFVLANPGSTEPTSTRTCGACKHIGALRLEKRGKFTGNGGVFIRRPPQSKLFGKKTKTKIIL